jgi:hypothetical protein
MNFGMVSNPKKGVTVNFSSEKVLATFKKLVEGLHANDTHLVKPTYKIETFNEVLMQLTLSATELFSLGVSIDINLEEVSAEKTTITVEVKRNFGSFDEPGEVQLANDHITNIFKTISELLMDPDKDYAPVRQAAADAQADSTSKQWQIIGWIFLAFVLLVMMANC